MPDYRKATLAGVEGQGYVEYDPDQTGSSRYLGYWKSAEGHDYETLHPIYMARECVIYSGPVYNVRADKTENEDLNVTLIGWPGEDHPDSIRIERCPDHQVD
ncbi:MAG: hypothetical protein U5L04_00905 [Trueperaceae bacterium]|nr:hypothetical protein [Trueperaceae bacterium]